MDPLRDLADSSDLLWEMVCAYEDGDALRAEDIRSLSASDRALLTEEIDRINHARNVQVDRAVPAHGHVAAGLDRPPAIEPRRSHRCVGRHIAPPTHHRLGDRP